MPQCVKKEERRGKKNPWIFMLESHQAVPPKLSEQEEA